MGQAFDENNEILAEAFGELKKEVFDELMEKAPEADKIVIKTIKNKNKDLKNRLSLYSVRGEQIFIDSLNRILELEEELKNVKMRNK